MTMSAILHRLLSPSFCLFVLFTTAMAQESPADDVEGLVELQSDSVAAEPVCNALDSVVFNVTSYLNGRYENRGIIRFQNGTCELSKWTLMGFKPGPYYCQNADSVMRVRSKHSTLSQGDVVFEGDVIGDAIRGTVTWEKEFQLPIIFHIEGTRKGSNTPQEKKRKALPY